MDESVADELQKLGRDERKTRSAGKWLQELLATRFNLKVHNEAREFPVYFLEIAKSGSKLKEAKAEDANATKAPNSIPLTNVIRYESGDAGATKMTGHGVSISFLARKFRASSWAYCGGQDRTDGQLRFFDAVFAGTKRAAGWGRLRIAWYGSRRALHIHSCRNGVGLEVGSGPGAN